MVDHHFCEFVAINKNDFAADTQNEVARISTDFFGRPPT
jgi:hypothetical protein